MRQVRFRGIEFNIGLADKPLFRGHVPCKSRLDPDTNTILISPHTHKDERIQLIVNAMLRVVCPCPELELLGLRQLRTVDVT